MDRPTAPLRVAVVGLGYWGPNLARNFAALAGSELAWCCDASETTRARAIAPRFPRARFTADLDEVLADDTLDAVVARHARADARALAAARARGGQALLRREADGAVVADAEAVVAAARAADRVLMVGHLLEYHPGVVKLKELDRRRRARPGPVRLRQPAEPRQAAGRRERAVVARRARRLGPAAAGRRGAVRDRRRAARATCARASRTSCSASCASRPGLAAHLHLSWLDPHKERRFTVVGAQRMATFDDMALEGKITVYDKGFDQHAAPTASTSPARVTSGVRGCERGAAADRVRALRRRDPQRRRRRVSDGESGLRVVRVLEALQRSLDESRRARPRARWVVDRLNPSRRLARTLAPISAARWRRGRARADGRRAGASARSGWAPTRGGPAHPPCCGVRRGRRGGRATAHAARAR